MTAANKEADNEVLSQEDLDKLIVGDDPGETDSEDELGEYFSQEELDKLIAGDEQDETDLKGESDEPLSQEDLDKLVAGDDPDELDSGNEPDEFPSQEDSDKLVAGDNPDEQFSAEDLDELDFGNELDESISGDELDEPDLEDEMDESISEDGLESEIKIETEEITKDKDSKDTESRRKSKKKLSIFVAEKYKRKKKILIATAIMLCLLSGVGYLSMHNKKEKAPEGPKLPAMDGRSLVFDAFVIPFKESNKFAYLSFDISFRLTDEELEKEMTAKRDLLRGIIYDLIKEEVNKSGKLPSLDKIKEYIVESVNDVLSTGQVKEAYVIDFLAV